MPDEKTIQRYIKVKQLAESGVGGEQRNAEQILRRLEEQHPGISQSAESYLKAQNSTNQANGSNGGGFPRSWSDFFRQAESMFETATEFVENVAEVQRGRILAEDEVDCDSRVTRAGNLIIHIKMDLKAYQRATRLNRLQKQAFREALHELLNEQLDGLLGE